MAPKTPNFNTQTKNIEKINSPSWLSKIIILNFLNSSFTETDASKNIEEKPKIKIHSKDLEKLNIKNNEIIEIGNNRAKLKIHTEAFDDLLPGVVIVEGVWPNECFIEGLGINSLIGSVLSHLEVRFFMTLLFGLKKSFSSI